MKPVYRARVKVELHNAIHAHFGKSNLLLGIRIGKIEKAEPIAATTCGWSLPKLQVPEELGPEVLAIVARVREKFPRIIRPING